MRDKIKTREEISRIAKELKGSGKSVVMLNGSFDLLHVGHVRLLQEAKRQGDALIVGLNSDDSVRQWKKHIGYKDWASRPLNSQENRAVMLAALESVDYVTIFDELDPRALIEVIRPDVFVNGSDYGEDCLEAPVVKKCGGKVHIIKLVDGYSTSRLIQRIKEVYKD